MPKIIKNLIFVLLPSLVLPSTTLAEITTVNNPHWWNGFSITPAAGFRHLGIKIIRKSDDYFGNISNAGFAQAVATLNMTSPSYALNNSGSLKLELNTYSAFLNIDNQFYADDNVSSSSSGNSGTRVEVGTAISGYYTYFMPTLKWEAGTPEIGKFGFGIACGVWTSNFSGNIILTPDERPVTGMPADTINFRTNKEAAYRVTLSWTTPGNWIWLMSVSGSNANDAVYNYELEEVSMMLGKQFVF